MLKDVFFVLFQKLYSQEAMVMAKSWRHKLEKRKAEKEGHDIRGATGKLEVRTSFGSISGDNCAGHEEDLEASRVKIGELSERIRILNDERDGLRAYLRKKEAEIRALLKDREELASIRLQKEFLAGRVKDLEVAMLSLKSEKEELIKELVESRQFSSGNNERMEPKIHSLECQLMMARKENNNLENQLRQLKESGRNLELLCEAGNAEISKRDAEIVEARGEIRDLRAREEELNLEIKRVIERQKFEIECLQPYVIFYSRIFFYFRSVADSTFRWWQIWRLRGLYKKFFSSIKSLFDEFNLSIAANVENSKGA